MTSYNAFHPSISFDFQSYCYLKLPHTPSQCRPSVQHCSLPCPFPRQSRPKVDTIVLQRSLSQSNARIPKFVYRLICKKHTVGGCVEVTVWHTRWQKWPRCSVLDNCQYAGKWWHKQPTSCWMVRIRKSQEIHTAVTSNSRLNRIMTAESNSSFIGQRNESYEDRRREENMIIWVRVGHIPRSSLLGQPTQWL